MVRKSLMNNIRITAWTLLILTTSATLVSIFATVGFDIEKKMSGTLRKLGPNAVAAGSGGYEALESIAKKKAITMVELTTDIVITQGKPVVIVMSDPEKLARITPTWVILGRRAMTQGECLLGKYVAQVLKLKPGMSIEVYSPSDRTKKINYHITGIIVSGDENDDRIVIPTVDSTVIKNQGSGFALLSVPQGEAGINRLNTELRQAQSNIEIKPLREIIYGEKTTLKKVLLLFSVALMAVLLLTALGVTSALLSRVVERRKELALLRAIGATQRAVMGFLLLEGLVIGSVASLGGFLVGTFISETMIRQTFHVSATPQLIAFPITLAATFAVSLVASGMGVVRALRMQPALALRGE